MGRQLPAGHPECRQSASKGWIPKAAAYAWSFISIGISGNVYPAAGFVQLAWKARKIEVNVKDTEISSAFEEHLIGPASIEVPKLVSLVLDSSEGPHT